MGYISRQLAALAALWARWQLRRLAKRVLSRTRHRDRVIARATRLARDSQVAAEAQVRESEMALRAERELFRRELAERDSKIKLLELELQGVVAINARYAQYIERDLAIYARQIEEVKSSNRPLHSLP